MSPRRPDKGWTFAFVLCSVCVHMAATKLGSLRGIGYMTVTTDDLELSTKFYTEVLGGMQVKELSFSLHGDDHYYRYFQKEILEARTQGVDPQSLHVPDISDSGDYEVRGEFVVFGNGIIQLQTFSKRGNHSEVFRAHEPHTSPAIVPAPHFCFWVKDSANFNHYIHELEANAARLGMPNVRVNRPVPLASESDRATVPEEKLGVTFTDGDFAGVSFAYFKGPTGEQLELFQILNQSRYHVGEEWCKRRAVSPAFVSNYSDNSYKRNAGYSGQLYGLFQFGTRTADLATSVKFYTQVLGAQLIQKPIQAVNVRGDDAAYMLFHKEIWDALRWKTSRRDIGIADLWDSGNNRLDHRFNLFDNYVVETLQYTDGRDLSAPKFNPRWNHSSMAYSGDMSVSFLIDEASDFNSVVRDVEVSAKAKGFTDVLANRPVNVSSLGESVGLGQYSRPIASGPLKGLNYVFFKGWSGEHFGFVQFKDEAKAKLKAALLQYGAMSTAFPETNPWTSDGFDQFCSAYTDPIVG
ncbi:uncharacterized protein LOC101857434 [Aplysia californica]|uniref:Uncharacterized protein LOC101857434 n=1 Tax=Aplysia californica TaxID=6500 RepID=A0ABM0K1L7_APLCA|nr:uncharacterized protein LOC101857434 [Aplysia californica]